MHYYSGSVPDPPRLHPQPEIKSIANCLVNADAEEHIFPLVTTPYPVPVNSEPPPLPADAIPSPFAAMTPLAPSPHPLPIPNPAICLQGGYEPPTNTPAPTSSSPCPKNHPNKGKGKAPPYKKKTPICWTCGGKGHIQKNCIW